MASRVSCARGPPRIPLSMSLKFLSSVYPAVTIRFPLASVSTEHRNYAYALCVRFMDILQRCIDIDHDFSLADVFPIPVGSVDVERDRDDATCLEGFASNLIGHYPPSPKTNSSLNPAEGAALPVSNGAFQLGRPWCASSDLLSLWRIILSRGSFISPFAGPPIPMAAYSSESLGRHSALFNPGLTPGALRLDSAESGQKGPSSHLAAQNVTLALYASFLLDPTKLRVLGANVGYRISLAMRNVA
ncbi:hypothetical protein E4U53_005169 [Claviceps sorghi]|nr:hypothetical protein E4U53_005169 [Claviceps sorghi]